MKLDGRVAIITGGASGIGRAVAVLFAAEGARVAVVDQDAADGRAVATAIAKAGGTARAFAADVAEVAATEEIVGAVAKDWGAPWILVTAAAISVGKLLTDTTEAEWDRVFAVNVKGTAFWCKAVLPHMVAARRGAIVTVASQLAFAGGRGSASYTATKGAIVSLTRALALDYAEHGVRVNALVPGAIETPLLARAFARAADPEAARQRTVQRHPLGRIGTPEEVARGALYLASDDSSFTTGAMLMIDGGWLAV